MRTFLTALFIVAALAAQSRPPAPAPAAAPAPAPFVDLENLKLDIQLQLKDAFKQDAFDLREEAQLLAMAAFEAQEAVPPAPPIPPAAIARIEALRDRGLHGNYRRGTQALDEHKYDDAVRIFDSVLSRKDPRSDGALYWKAYALNKLGKKQESLTALDQLQKDFAQSAWLNDARALRLEVQQSSGQPVSPESQSDEELKLLAINGLMNSEQERAMPLLEKVLADPKASPRVRQRALFVLAQSRSPKSRESLMSIAKGGGNPDMQAKAIEYLGAYGAKAELAQLYANAPNADAKLAIIDALSMARDSDKLGELAKAERDPKLRAAAIGRLGMFRNDNTAQLLASMYSSEADAQMKKSILEGLYVQRNGKVMVDLARKETDPAMKKAIVERLANMKSKEATEYMLELLGK